MYKGPNKQLWHGRVDADDAELGVRWHQKIQYLPYPYKNKGGIVFLGFDCDEGVKRNKGRIGAANGGDALKKVMGNFAWHLHNTQLYDGGKIVAATELSQAQNTLAQHVFEMLTKQHFPIVLGGGHEVAFASFSGLHNFYNKKADVAIINFDAHFDLRVSENPNSGTPFTQIADLCAQDDTEFSYMCLGVSTAANTQALFKKAHDLNVSYILDVNMTYVNIDNIKSKLDNFLAKKDIIYITIDVDAFCAYQILAASAPAARGIDIALTYAILEYLFIKYKDKIKLVDIAEFNPVYDLHGIGVRAISRLIYDIVMLRDNL